MPHKKHNARSVLDAIETICRTFNTRPPYFHVGDEIHTHEELQAVHDGTRYGYMRFGGHPDHIYLEQALTKYYIDSSACRVYASGMGAIAAALYAALEVKAAPNKKTHVVALLPCYGNTYQLVRELSTLSLHGITYHFLNLGNPQYLESLHAILTKDTAIVFFEIIANPTLMLADVQKIIAICRDRSPQSIIICDDTFLFGLFQPFKWGVDLVVSSGTKYLAGESAWLLGHCALSNSFSLRVPKFLESLKKWSSLLGATAAPFETWVTGQFSVATLHERIAQHSRNAMAVAKFLQTHPCVRSVVYPGLASYPFVSILKYIKPINNEFFFGGIVSFYVNSDNPEQVLEFLFQFGKFQPSLAGPDDMIEGPLWLSHKSYDPEDRQLFGISPNLIRFSAGRTPIQKTIDALDHALRKTIPQLHSESQTKLAGRNNKV